ncbi:helix-turn-helix domain-containing protein [Actinomyces bowdenii]|uniref:Helix-turn-helix transcriptional regulator n=1 Tax=Actinomyces bowdenii TaxID=131109 RepID=A0A853EMX8_9ACTO|nr:helix-turn-helix transcriptional regulator [Actinomyces bowdenii]MBF0696953.1 helix-turn-helix transcriptional regulator [Actinomyces bowdenii]NYS69126.1 helix-turn-helix transcriptional regulator [Actinomyces bowdenii]
MDIYELLGENPDDPGHRHARDLVAADRAMVRDLVAVRERYGMTQADVARAMGTNQASISRFESGHSDAHLSTVRRYAKAVGALIRHEVTAVNEDRIRLTAHAAGIDSYNWDSSVIVAARRVPGGEVVGS